MADQWMVTPMRFLVPEGVGIVTLDTAPMVARMKVLGFLGFTCARGRVARFAVHELRVAGKPAMTWTPGPLGAVSAELASLSLHWGPAVFVEPAESLSVDCANLGTVPAYFLLSLGRLISRPQR